ncbi:hypothetical protein [Sandarakinorhabdus sp.]|uniref:hypothetical protein n=1 Tax=Sandarakinorhabdus sp. TaxID=1916663 RepID=UPI003340CDD4
MVADGVGWANIAPKRNLNHRIFYYHSYYCGTATRCDKPGSTFFAVTKRACTRLGLRQYDSMAWTAIGLVPIIVAGCMADRYQIVCLRAMRGDFCSDLLGSMKGGFSNALYVIGLCINNKIAINGILCAKIVLAVCCYFHLSWDFG